MLTLTDLLSWVIQLGNYLLTLAVNVVTNLKKAALDIAGLIIQGAWDLLAYLGPAGRWIERIYSYLLGVWASFWDTWQKPLFVNLAQLLSRLAGAWRTWLDGLFSGQYWPLLEALRGKIAALWALWYSNTGTALALRGSRGVGIEIAARLERLLFDVERQTADALGLVQDRVDGLAAWTNHAWDGSGVMQELPVYWTLYAYGGALQAAILQSLSPAPDAPPVAYPPLPDPVEVLAGAAAVLELGPAYAPASIAAAVARLGA